MNWTKLGRVYLQGVVFLLLALVAAPLLADEGDPPSRAARLSYIEGTVSFQPSGETEWSAATLNYTLTTGDRLYTDQGGRAELEVGRSSVRMSEGTDLTLANLDDQTLQLGIGQGSIRVSVYELPAGNAVEIDTPNGALTALGPGSYRVDVDPNNGTQVSVNSGSLQISGGGADQTVGAGQAVQLSGTGPIQIDPVALPGQDDFDQWCASRDQRIRSFQSPQYVSPDIPGAEDLDANGRWQNSPDYGPVWYPTGVPAGWVPYHNGHWAWIEPWGWTWVEDEPWGYCPFHYGRWAFIGASWGWVPGPVVAAPVYAPALVAFVGGAGFSVGLNVGGLGVAAWFPLGPREPFFPSYHHDDNYLRRVNATNIRNVTNINTIINVNNANNIHYVNQRVGTTAVSGDVFRSGQAVGTRAVRVSPEQLARAQVIAHPEIAPARAAAFGGRTPVQAPPVRARVTGGPPATRGGQQPAVRGGLPAGGGPPAGGARPASAPPVFNRSAPPVNNPPVRTETPQPQRNAPPVFNRTTAARPAPAAPPPTPPRVITRTPPPARDLPFSAHQPALNQHPGRPLEPQQEQNIRQGKPAGPMRDQEVPSHASSHPAPAAKESKPSKNKH